MRTQKSALRERLYPHGQCHTCGAALDQTGECQTCLYDEGWSRIEADRQGETQEKLAAEAAKAAAQAEEAEAARLAELAALAERFVWANGDVQITYLASDNHP